MSKGVELSIGELISRVREELMKAKKTEESSTFTLTEMELELNVVTSKTSKGELKFVVMGAGGEVQKERISKIKLKFSPYSPMFFSIERGASLLPFSALGEESNIEFTLNMDRVHAFCKDLMKFIEQQPDEIRKQIISELSKLIKNLK
jgi:hypothetical protein